MLMTTRATEDTMSAKPLTAKMVNAIRLLRGGGHIAQKTTYDCGGCWIVDADGETHELNGNTLNGLFERGLIRCHSNRFPIQSYILTVAGHTALSAKETA